MPNNRKQYIWLPYANNITAGAKKVKIDYKGGQIDSQWKDIHSIMFYGATADIPQDFLEKCALYKIPVVIHRRNIPRAVIICPTLPPDQESILTKQIIFRENQKKKSYIAKKLLQAKFKSMNWLTPLNRDLLYRITDTQTMLNIEAWHAKNYWSRYYKKLNIRGSRRGNNQDIPGKCLDAVSKFVSGVMLRWILYHSISPYHGFLHKPTDYPALVYDLIEPYRGYFDKAVFDAILAARKDKAGNDQQCLAYAIENLKKLLDSTVYVEATRQTATFQEMLHGVVLALRSYLIGNTKRFIVPLPSKPNGGRPIKAGYRLYGHIAGKTDFWEQTKKVAAEFERQYPIN